MVRRVYRKKRKVYRKKRVGYKTVQRRTRIVPGSFFPFRKSLSYNPQFMKVKRTFQLSGPATDVTAGKFLENDLLCVCNVNDTMAYNSGALTFRANQVPNISEFGALYDQYRIIGVKLTFHYNCATEAVPSVPAANETTTSYLSNFCNLYLFSDFDDATSPTASEVGVQAMLETGRSRRRTFPGRKNMISYYIKPRIIQSVYDSSGTQTAQTTKYKQWIDGATALDAKYYGIKWLIEANPTTGFKHTHGFRVYATYYFHFRQRQ